MSLTVITKPKIEIDEKLLKQLKTQAEESGQVILHFIYQSISPWGSMIRIWPTTYLYDNHSDHQSELVHAENISYYPEWTECESFERKYFTLIFSGLPKSCTSFDFEEHCNGSGGEFFVRNISRNEQDVYYLLMS